MQTETATLEALSAGLTGLLLHDFNSASLKSRHCEGPRDRCAVMKYVSLYLFFMFIGLPLVMMTHHVATLPEEAQHDLADAVKDLNGRIYQARISCHARRDDHIMRVHGRNPEDALRQLQDQLPRCDVEILDGASDPIWKEAVRSAL